MTAPIRPDALVGAWLHSHEEDTPTTTVYRKADYDFPPSRGRQGFELSHDGTLAQKTIGPADRGQHVRGTWRLTPQGCLELLAPGDAAQPPPPQVLQLESVDSGRLVVRKSAPACRRP
jgi:hypothetical protein